LKVSAKIRYVFRRPKFPIVCVVADELISARSPAAFQRQIERFELESDAVLEIVDATGEGWAFHAELMVVLPLALKKTWRKLEVARLYNESQNARRVGGTYPETALPEGHWRGSSEMSQRWLPLQSRTCRFGQPRLASHPHPDAARLDASRVAGAGSRSCR
jgi:hypothetical protein